MAGHPNAMPMLRLVSAAAVSAPGPSRQVNTPVQPAGPLAIAAENHAAAGLSAVDARWVFAVQVARSLQGGRAAALSPDRRRRLVATAVGMGLRPFDANLVIAIVQDGVRCGEVGLTRAVEDRLAIVPAARSAPKAWAPLTLALTGLLALSSLAALIAWLMH